MECKCSAFFTKAHKIVYLHYVKEKGLTIVGVKLYIADNGYAKLLIALAKGKKEYDKRASIKEKDLRREMERI